jgi:hypothetical protein
MSAKRLCRKCHTKIPIAVVIAGVKHNLQRRKFCLECSPFGLHNTMIEDPQAPRSIHTVFKREDARIAWQLSAAKAQERARQLKHELIMLAGGACARCGYHRYEGALEFHHTNPKEKLFCLSTNNLRITAREQILAEFAKCMLLCSNCHKEVEAERRALKPARLLRLQLQQQELKKANRQPQSLPLCADCGKGISRGSMHCRECYSPLQIKWPLVEELLAELAGSTLEAVGRRLGVSGKAVKKHLLNRGAALHSRYSNRL